MVELAPRTHFRAIQALLESEDFYCDVTAVSTTPHFYRRLHSHETVRLLAQYIYESPSNVDVVLDYAQKIALSASGEERSQKDAALCACVLALSFVANPRVEEFLRWLRRSHLLSLAWAAELADYLFSVGSSLSESRWSPLGYLLSIKISRVEPTTQSTASFVPPAPWNVYEAANSFTGPIYLAA